MQRRITLGFVAVLLIFCAVLSPLTTHGKTDVILTSQKPQKVKNVIFMIGDGMGEMQIALGRAAKGSPLAMDQLQNRASISTANVGGGVTDSAAAATAMACGQKTLNGYLGVDEQGKPLQSLIEISQSLGKHTGLITTTTITYATPAAFASHVDNRGDENQIAVQMMEHSVDVLLGGGKGFFQSNMVEDKGESVTLLSKAKVQGYDTVFNKDDLLASRSGRIIGLFDVSHMPFERQRDVAFIPSLSQMEQKALDTLGGNPKGFFLMVEGGRIDHACHNNSIDDAAAEVMAFDDAVKTAMNFVQKHPDTLLVVTADHETGGLMAADTKTVAGFAFTSGGHTGANVPAFAMGFGSEAIQGQAENTQVFTWIQTMMSKGVAVTSGPKPFVTPLLTPAKTQELMHTATPKIVQTAAPQATVSIGPKVTAFIPIKNHTKDLSMIWMVIAASILFLGIGMVALARRKNSK